MDDCLKDIDDRVLEKLKTLDAVKDLDEIINILRDNWAWKDYCTLTKNKLILCTGGWSSHEAVINALTENYMFWMLYWQKSERGGKYTFDLTRRIKKEK